MKIVTSGRVSFQKNPKLFNDIAEYFKNIKFTWIGSGELESELKSENIEVTGWKDKDELIKILNDSDIFMLTSFGEGLSVSLIEAMALKKICIVSNVIGNKEVIINGKNGFVCNNLEEFINVISLIQKGKFDLNEISENGFNDVLEKYNTKIMCEEYSKIYRS